MASPTPLPAEAKRKRGTLRRDRTPTPITVLAPSDPASLPENLGPAGQRIWRLVHERGSAWVGHTDTETVRLLCEAMDRRAELIARLANDGWVLYTDKGYAYQHPAAGMLTALEAQITKWLSLLGMTPSDRGRIGAAEVQAVSKLEQLRAARAARLGS